MMAYTSLRRHVVGLIALLLLISALGLLLAGGEGNRARIFGALCLRASLTLGVIWLALPQLIAISRDFPPRLMIALGVGGAIVICRPKFFPIVLIAVLAVGLLEFAGRFLGPPGKKR